MKYVYVAKSDYMFNEKIYGVFATKEKAEEIVAEYKEKELPDTIFWVEKWELEKTGSDAFVDIFYLNE